MRLATVLVLLVVTVFSACGPGNGPSEKTGAETASGSSIVIKGSDTMVHLVTEWAETYMGQHPDVDISVTGGGSGTGIAALLNGTVDICAASRDMSAEEKEKAAGKGIEPKETVVARDGIAIIVNPNNGIGELSMDQLKKIYTGATTNWSQVGGADGKIQLLSRETSSGTYVFFQEHVLKKEDFAPETLLMPATSSIIQSASTDAMAIGYVGLGYAAEAGDKVKVLAVKADDAAPAIQPSDETVQSGTYSIARPLYLYTNGAPSGAVADFMAFCLGEQGQAIVRETGYVQVK